MSFLAIFSPACVVWWIMMIQVVSGWSSSSPAASFRSPASALQHHTIITSSRTPHRPKLPALYQSSMQQQQVQDSTTTTTTTTTTPSTKMMMIPFKKYHGLGNDFILIDNRNQKEPSINAQQAIQLCHRNMGIGADGVIFALQPSSSSSSTTKDDIQYDFRMRIYNSDGSEPEMCGNGIRCLTQFLYDLGERVDQSTYYIETNAGPIIPIRNENDGLITVDMGEPILEAKRIPTTIPSNDPIYNSVVEQTIQSKNGKTWKVTTVSMGNPHAIIFVNDLEVDVHLANDGSVLETDLDLFPARTNVEFVQVLPKDEINNCYHLKMKVWERGAGPTLACGTGACALTVAAIRTGRITRDIPTRVSLPGGDLWIEWKESNNHVYMTGPAVLAYEGMVQV